jgi:hypothetical protein
MWDLREDLLDVDASTLAVIHRRADMRAGLVNWGAFVVTHAVLNRLVRGLLLAPDAKHHASRRQRRLKRPPYQGGRA